MVAKRKLHQFGYVATARVPVPTKEAFRSGARKGSIARAEEPNGACRPRGNHEVSKLDSTCALKEALFQKIKQQFFFSIKSAIY